MSATGTWNAEVESPMGKAVILFDLVEDGATLTGGATSDGDRIEITKGSVSGNALTWALLVNKPMKMTLTFKVDVSGDSFSGTAKPSVFPASKVTASRVGS